MVGLFPAHAGVILSDAPVACLTTAFPRTRGGDPPPDYDSALKRIFSPHTRGCSQGLYRLVYSFLLFPAHAGVILPDADGNQLYQSFPRTRGGDPQLLMECAELEVFSPHTRG